MAIRALLTAFFGSIAIAAAAAPASVALQPHKAVYELSMMSAKSGSGVGDYAGRLAIEWADACEGYITTQRIASRLVNTEGGETRTDIQMTSWESRDGKTFRFTSRTRTDGEMAEEYEGRAETAGKAPPAVIYTKPSESTVDLPRGTIFPTEHSVLLIKGAREGLRAVEATVFDGSGPDKIFRVVAFMSGAKDGSAAERPELAGQESWRFRLAYFMDKQPDSTPDYEIGYRMYANGVSTDLVLDYGDFSVKGTLVSLEYLPRSGC